MIVHRKITGLDSVDYFLNGGIVGGTDLRKASGGLFLHGKTLIFTSPSSVTVTFAATPASAQTPLSIKEVLAQIKAAVAALTPSVDQEGHLRLIEATPASGVAITELGTANALLGFGKVVPVAGVVYNAPDGAAPRYLSTALLSNSETYLVVTEDS